MGWSFIVDKEKVIKTMERGIYYFINWYKLDLQDQEDVYQQCVEKILLSIDDFDPNKGVKLNQFLMSRIRGVVKEAVRKENKKAIPMDDIFIVDSSSVEKNILLQEEIKQLKAAMETLSQMQHKVIELKYFYNLSMSEIAFVLDIHYSTVAKYHQRGLKALRKHLTTTQGDGGFVFFE